MKPLTPKQRRDNWIEALQVEVMEDYLLDVQGQDYSTNPEIMRKHFEKLVAFIDNLLDVDKQRTKKQNNSMHKYFQEVADELNATGVPRKIFYKNLYVDYTLESVKDLFKFYLKELLKKESTTEMEKGEVTKVYEEVNRHLSDMEGYSIHIPFPSVENENGFTDEIINNGGYIK